VAALNLNFLSGTLDPRITFSRPSNATMFDASGNLTYAPNNLSLYSQELDNAAWTKTNATATANSTIAPDGTLTADTLLDTAVSNIHYTYQSITTYSPVGKTFIVSVYAKANTLNYVTVGLTDISIGDRYAVAVFNLSNGTLSTSGAAGTGYAVSSPVITSAGSGWYRCSVVCTVGSTAPFLTTFVGLNKTGVITAAAGGLESYLGNGSGIYVWGAQLEAVTYQTLPRSYVATTSSAYYGPRFDYDPATLQPQGLLIEEARTNIQLQSNNFSNASWTAGNVTIAGGVTTGPDGTNSGASLTQNSANSTHLIYASSAPAVTGLAVYTRSVFMKAGTSRYGMVNLLGAGNLYVTAIFDLVAGTVTQTSAGNGGAFVGTPTIINAGNGWWRVSASYTTNTGFDYGAIGMAQTATGNTLTVGGQPTFLGDGTSYIYVYGAQLEAGSFATSYIPTAASSVARSADTASMTGANFSSWYNATAGAFLVQFDTPASGTRIISAADDNTANNNIQMLTSGTNPTFLVTTSGAVQASIDAGTVAANTVYKFAGTYSTNDFAACISGGAVGTDTSGTIPTVDRLRIGVGQAGNALCGHIALINYYPQRLPNATLQSLTS
jgi:hypothetical protein